MPAQDNATGDPGGLNSKSVPRRKLIEGLLGTGFLATAVAFLYPVVRFLVPPKTLDTGGDTVVAGKTGELKPNSGKIFRFGSRPGLLVRTAGGEYRAMSATCTHLSCTVQYRDDLQHVWCACHNGHYNLNGKNVEGPPPRPLDAYVVNVRGNQIVVSKSA